MYYLYLHMIIFTGSLVKKYLKKKQANQRKQANDYIYRFIG